jgi:cell division protein FtsZ
VAGSTPTTPTTPAAQPPAHVVQPSAVRQPEPVPVPVAVVRPPRTVTFDDNDDLDVPDFLK